MVLGVRTGLARTAGRVGGRTSFSSTILELRRSHLGAASIFYWLSNEVQGQCEWDERAAQWSAGAWWEAGVWEAGEEAGGRPEALEAGRKAK